MHLLDVVDMSDPAGPPVAKGAVAFEVMDISESEEDLVDEDLASRTAAQRTLQNQAEFEHFLAQKSSAEPAAVHSGESASGETSSPQTKDIDRIREYQDELFERAKAENIIAVLDTGSGKTLIAALLMRHVANQELIDRANGRSPRISFFLVNSVHLVRQQQKMLANNLPVAPAGLSGSGREDLWSKVGWHDLFEKNQAIVCTAEVLNQSLFHSYIRMEQINLLIIDEAHHAKKDHPYARIIMDYYVPQRHSSLCPRIFSMTASPVDTKRDLTMAATTLEALLDSKIVTTKSLSLLEHVARPKEEDWEYSKLLAPRKTDLFRQLEALRHVQVLNSSFIFAYEASSKLGRWCSDQVWDYTLSGNEFIKVLGRFEQSKVYSKLESAEERKMAVDLIRLAEKIVKDHNFAKPTLTEEDLSSKVTLLHEKLTDHYDKNPKTRCIVFVNQRLTARLLADLFRHLEIKNLRPGILVGVTSGGPGDIVESIRQQEKNMEYFRAGLFNCMFATGVAEEGLDVPECNLVVRFDLYDTAIRYMQSRGRARMKDSIFANMIEKNNLNEREMVDFAMDSERYLRYFCNQLPEDRFLGRKEMTLEAILSREKETPLFKTKSGCLCNFSNSLLILARYAKSLQYENAAITEASFELEIVESGFKYKAILPEESRVAGVSGGTYPNKALAKRSAAWETCYKLRQKRLLDENLDPIYRKKRPAGANALLAVRNIQESYDMLVKPQFWNLHSGNVPQLLYPTLIYLSAVAGQGEQRDPLLLLTREPFPKLQTFPVYLENDIQGHIGFIHAVIPLRVNDMQLTLLTSFTLMVFCDIFNKEYKPDSKQMGYWLAPSKISPSDVLPTAFEDLVDVDLLCKLEHGKRMVWSPGMSPQLWLDRFLVDPWAGKYRYFSRSIVPGATKDSHVPSGAAHRAQRMKNVLAYTLSLFKLSAQKFIERADPHQPVIAAEVVHSRRNFLDKMNTKEKSEKVHAHICPEPLEISLLPVSLVRTCLIIPSIIHRLDSSLIALEAFQKLNLQVPAELALEAVTKDSDNTEEHQNQQIHFQRGMGKNYERLEFIGDSLLKMTTTIMVFIRYPKSDELGFHVKRMMMLCNSNLFNVATEPSLNLPQYIRTKSFNRSTWYPENLVLLSGRGALHAEGNAVSHGIGRHGLGEKTIADVSEAIIGACLLATRDQSKKFDMGVRAVTRLVKNPDHDIDKWEDMPKQYAPPSWQLQTGDPIAFDLAAKVEQKMGYRFKYPRLLRSAFTHPSDMRSTVPDYQRLEFLGDAVLDMVCINWLFNKFEDRNPQWLTEHKMAMVSNKFLAAVAIVLDFDKFMTTAGTNVLAQVSRYSRKVRDIMEVQDVRRDFWTQIEDPPKALSDLVESYLGAVMVDSGFNYSEAESFFEKHILWFFKDIKLYDSFANKHPTTYLYKRLTDEFGCRDYNILNSEGRESAVDVLVTAGVLIHGQVVASADSNSARYAKVKASTAALRILEPLTPAEFRMKYNCTCKAVEVEVEAEAEQKGEVRVENGSHVGGEALVESV